MAIEMTTREMFDLMGRYKNAQSEDQVTMHNGKKLSDCTGTELRETRRGEYCLQCGHKEPPPDLGP